MSTELVFERHAAGAEYGGGHLHRMFRGELTGVIIEGAFGASQLSEGLTAFQQRLPLDARPFSPRFEAYSYGHVLDHCGVDLSDYHRESVRLCEYVDSSFGPRFAASIDALLTRLADPSPVTTPRAATGLDYAPYTIRRYPKGGLIPPHCEIEQLSHAAYHDLAPQLARDTLLSFLVMLEAPDSGGDLVVYDLRGDDARVPEFYGDRRVAHSVRDGFSHQRVSLAAGDLIVFDGGRRFHQILPVEGTRPRWTLGGFMAPAADGSRWLRWS